nr:immunoglobulin light chain junction region [Macaca mulatta]MOX84932.1 immunoglobulin light chain junction region [Macaca mulatta]MOX85097.1 immunoglobulin light chain junction region [Macaca mulatta]MOX85333.1 immunoglobulin light chain junction region [Macaca mulatta]MOX85843.1 immunoglobulin light chain junction region [Macaca mulatta]
CLQYNSIPYSF